MGEGIERESERGKREKGGARGSHLTNSWRLLFRVVFFFLQKQGDTRGSAVPRRRKAFGSPSAHPRLASSCRRCLTACFPLAPLPFACVLFTVCFARLSQKEKFSFFEIFFSSRIAFGSALIRSLAVAYRSACSLIFRILALASLETRLVARIYRSRS